MPECAECGASKNIAEIRRADGKAWCLDCLGYESPEDSSGRRARPSEKVTDGELADPEGSADE